MEFRSARVTKRSGLAERVERHQKREGAVGCRVPGQTCSGKRRSLDRNKV